MSAALSLPAQHAAIIEDFAVQLAHAQEEVRAADASLGAAEAHRDKIAGRIAELAAKRNDVIARRRAGQEDPADGASLALIQADTEGLQAMLPDAAGRVTAAQNAHSLAASQVMRFQEEIGRAEALAARDQLALYAAELGDKLFATVRAIETATKRAGVGGRPPWGPTREFQQTLRMLAAARGELW